MRTCGAASVQCNIGVLCADDCKGGACFDGPKREIRTELNVSYTSVVVAEVIEKRIRRNLGSVHRGHSLGNANRGEQSC